MKRWIALGIAVSPLWVAAVSPSSIDGRAIAARFFQCCTLTSDFPAASFTYNIEYVGTVGTQPERDAFAVRVGDWRIRSIHKFCSTLKAASINPPATHDFNAQFGCSDAQFDAFPREKGYWGQEANAEARDILGVRAK